MSGGLAGFNDPDDEREFSITAVAGFRGWFVDLDTGELASTNQPYVWPQGENVATHVGAMPLADTNTCAEQFHPESTWAHKPECPRLPTCEYPSVKCGHCGFYAYHDKSFFHSAPSRPLIVGVITGYGRCVIGTKGFRAGKAVIVALTSTPYVTTNWLERHEMTHEALMERVRPLLRERYWAVAVFEDTDEMLARVPLTGGRT